MAAPSSLEAVKRKIQCLQQQADEAEDRAQVLQRELDLERDLREKVRPPGLPVRLSRSLSPGLRCSFLPLSGSLSLPGPCPGRGSAAFTPRLFPAPRTPRGAAAASPAPSPGAPGGGSAGAAAA